MPEISIFLTVGCCYSALLNFAALPASEYKQTVKADNFWTWPFVFVHMHAFKRKYVLIIFRLFSVFYYYYFFKHTSHVLMLPNFSFWFAGHILRHCSRPKADNWSTAVGVEQRPLQLHPVLKCIWVLTYWTCVIAWNNNTNILKS